MEHFSIEEAQRRYLPLMHELAKRLEIVDACLKGKLNLSAPFALEFAYLQLRKICELIALGSHLVHEDLEIPKKKKYKNWHANELIKLVEQVHPNFFPQAITRECTSEGWSINANCKPGALTLPEFKELYNECGEELHRGSLKTLESSSGPTEEKISRVREWLTKLCDLMNEHLIVQGSKSSFYVVSLRTNSGYPECSRFMKNSSGGLDVQTFNLKGAV